MLLGVSFEINCWNYHDKTCGGYNKEYKIKCQKIGSFCEEVEIDDGCKIDASHQCSKQDGIPNDENCFNFGDQKKCKRVKLSGNCEVTGSNCIAKSSIDSKKKCEFDLYKKNCKEVDKVCSDYSDAKCGEIANNGKIQCAKISSYPQCREIEVDDKCKIENGECKAKGTLGQNEECSLNEDYTKCSPTKKYCSQCTSSCSECRVSRTGFSCIEVSSGKCTEVSIHQNCQINDGCKIKQGVGDGSCTYNWGSSICIFVDPKCKIENYLCVNNSPPEGQKCSLVLNECKPIPIECSDYSSQSDCKDISNKKCFWYTHPRYSYSNCLEYTEDDNCKVENGKCVKKKESGFNQGEDCSFDNEEVSDSVVKFSCKKKLLECSEITSNNCGNLNNCAFYKDEGHCIPTDNYCTIKDNKCQKKEGETENKNKKCSFGYDEEDGYICRSTDKQCKDYENQEDCNNAPKKGNSKCVYSKNKCLEVHEKCKIDSDGACVASQQLKENEYCILDYGDTYCRPYEYVKQCIDYSDDNCGGFVPEMTLCFNFNDTSGTCKEVKVDDSCQVNDNNECVAKGSLGKGQSCQFDEDKDSCFLNTENNSHSLNMRLLSLLALFFMF